MDKEADNTHAYIDSNNWLVIILGNKITRDDYLNLIAQVYDLALEIEEKNLLVKLLVDCTRLSVMEETVKEHIVKGTRDLQFNKIASFGLDPKYVPILVRIFQETDISSSSIQDFKTQKEAEEWLMDIVT